MTKSSTAILFLVLFQVACPCGAEPVSRQLFSKPELNTIDRNQTLRELLKSHPKAVRQALDVMQQNQIGARSMASEKSDSLQSRDESVADPDLEELERSNPEAARDLFLLIKRVATEKSRK